jgi:hypothetical protein
LEKTVETIANKISAVRPRVSIADVFELKVEFDAIF